MSNKKESGGGFDKTTDFKWFGIGLLVFVLIWAMPTPESMTAKAQDLFSELSAEEMTGWAAFFELKNERDEKQMEEAKRGSSRVMR